MRDKGLARGSKLCQDVVKPSNWGFLVGDFFDIYICTENWRDKNKLRDISFPPFVRGDIIYRERRGWISRVTNSLSQRHCCAVVLFRCQSGQIDGQTGLKTNHAFHRT